MDCPALGRDRQAEGNFSKCEYAWTSYNTPSKLFQFDNRTGDKIHPTQKPVTLYQWIFKNYAKPGFKILDTHLGNGSSRIAAYDAGLDFVGYEICKDYFDKQEQRFQNHIAQTSLFVGLKDDIEKEKLEVSCHSEDWIN